MNAQLHLLPSELPLPPSAGDRLAWRSLHGCAGAAGIAELAQRADCLVLMVTADSTSATRYTSALEFFGDAPSVLHFPDWETLPYDAFSPHQDIISERLRTLAALPDCHRGVLTVPVTTLLQKIAPRSFLAGSSFDLRVGQQFDTQRQREILRIEGVRVLHLVQHRLDIGGKGVDRGIAQRRLAELGHIHRPAHH